MERMVYEDKFIEVIESNDDYDFVGYVRNKSENIIRLRFGTDEDFSAMTVGANDWCGFLADGEEYEMLQMIKKGQFQWEIAED